MVKDDCRKGLTNLSREICGAMIEKSISLVAICVISEHGRNRSLFPEDFPSFLSADGSSLRPKEWKGEKSCKSQLKRIFHLNGFCKWAWHRSGVQKASSSLHS